MQAHRDGPAQCLPGSVAPPRRASTHHRLRRITASAPDASRASVAGSGTTARAAMRFGVLTLGSSFPSKSNRRMPPSVSPIPAQTSEMAMAPNAVNKAAVRGVATCLYAVI